MRCAFAVLPAEVNSRKDLLGDVAADAIVPYSDESLRMVSLLIAGSFSILVCDLTPLFPLPPFGTVNFLQSQSKSVLPLGLSLGLMIALTYNVMLMSHWGWRCNCVGSLWPILTL